MEEISANEQIKEKTRNSSKENRFLHRNDVKDSVRLGLGDIRHMIEENENLTETDVIKLSGRIKRNKHATKKDLYRLSNAFLQSNENIVAFIKIQGALQILVKELICNESEQQILACETICNLSLGDSLVCSKIATLSGSYLVMYLTSKECRLKQTCLWVILNILASSDKGIDILMDMEILYKLFLIFSNDKEDENVRKDAGIAMDLIISHDNNRKIQMFLLEHMQLIKADQSNINIYSKLLFTSLFSDPQIVFQDNQLEFIIDFLPTYILNHLNCLPAILYGIRSLANLFNSHGERVLRMLHSIESFCDILNRIFEQNNSVLNTECFWLIKNIVTIENYNNGMSILKCLKINRNICI